MVATYIKSVNEIDSSFIGFLQSQYAGLTAEVKIIIKPEKRNPRAGWDKAMQRLHAEGLDKLLVDNISDEHDTDWTWH